LYPESDRGIGAGAEASAYDKRGSREGAVKAATVKPTAMGEERDINKQPEEKKYIQNKR